MSFETVPCTPVTTPHGVIYIPATASAPDGADPSKRARHGSGVREFCEQLIEDGELDYAQIAAEARRRFGGATSANSVRWYASKMERTSPAKNQLKAAVALHYVMAHLIAEGFEVEVMKCSARRHLMGKKNGREVLVRSKASFGDEVPFGGRARLFVDLKDNGDFVAICDFRTGVTGAPVYLVPTKVLKKELELNQRDYEAAGETRTREGTCVIRWEGSDRPGNASFGYSEKFARYRNAWEQLLV